MGVPPAASFHILDLVLVVAGCAVMHETMTAAGEFHRSYYDSYIWQDTRWLGVPAYKCPFDLWVYQEILTEQRPDVIVETGTADGGSALFLASVCDLLGCGRVVTIDLEGRSSVDPEVLREVRRGIGRRDRVMVILDSDHSRDHVLAELRTYSSLVTPGQYLVVEDTNVNGHPLVPDFGPGPAEAVAEWLTGREDFETDRSREKFGFTFNPGGYLRRRA